MKLIDLLVRELPKRGGWPDGAVECQRFVDEANIDFYDENGNWDDDCLLAYGAIAAELVRKPVFSCEHEQVTFDQYQSALAASQKVEWSGEGKPDIGTKCEHHSDGQWEVVTIAGIYENLVTGFTDYWMVKEDGCSYTVGNPYRFRPLRTEADKKREIAIDWIVSIMPTDEMAETVAGYLYDAIAAGKIPGVKLED